MHTAEIIIKTFFVISNITPSNDLSPVPTLKSLQMDVGR
jgi:hypothetical protein